MKEVAVGSGAPRCLRLSLLALCSVAMAASVSAQGIYPGDLSKDGYKLPGGFEPVLQLRT